MNISIEGLELLRKMLADRIAKLDDRYPNQRKEKDVLTQILSQVLDALRELRGS